jgi:synaptobrevin family protein YKT6
MSDEEYPKMVASNILKKVMDEFTTENPPSSYRSSTSTVSFPRLETYLSKYQNPSESDPIMKIQKELDETKEALYETIDAVLARGVKIDDLVAKSSELSMTSKMFYSK